MALSIVLSLNPLDYHHFPQRKMSFYGVKPIFRWPAPCDKTQMPNAAAAVATRKPAAMATDEVWSRMKTPQSLG